MGLLDKTLGEKGMQEIGFPTKKQEDGTKTGIDTVRKLFAFITKNKEIKEKIGTVCSMDFLTELQPLTSMGYHFTYSLDGDAFAEDGCGGYYVLLQDTSIGYIGFAENECGRVAMNLQELLELELNCAYSWHNYGLEYSKLNNASLLAFEEKGREEFEDAYSLQYDEVRNEVSKVLNLSVSSDIFSEILPKFYKAATREPKFTAITSESKMSDIIA